jgi:hypothetical protein
MKHRWMTSTLRLGAVAAAMIVSLTAAAPASAAQPDLDRFKSEIDAFVGSLGHRTKGLVKWTGSDPYEIRREGDALVAVIANVRLSLNAQGHDHLTLDRVEIRQIGQKSEDQPTELALSLPGKITLHETDGAETEITLTGGAATATLEARSGRRQGTTVSIAGMRIKRPETGAWVAIGPLSLNSKLAAEPDGSWSDPIEFEVKRIEYFAPEGPFGGGIDRIAFTGKSAGPRLHELDKFRDAIEALQNDDSRTPGERGAALLAMLPTTPAPFAMIRGELDLEGLTLHNLAGETLVSLAKAGSMLEISGLDAADTALRLTLHHDGLELAPSILEKAKTPYRVTLDLGVSDLSTRTLGMLLQAAGTMANMDRASEGESQQQQQAVQQALGAAMMLNPTFHIYNAAVDTADVGIHLTVEAKGSPLSPKGYAAAGELAVRGFDALTRLSAGMPLAEFLPVLKALGVEKSAPDGTSQIDFRLASVPTKWITINGNDVSAWFVGIEAEPGRPRLLKPMDPPMRGDDVKRVQQALAAAKIPVAQDGAYSPSTAAAVARFQKGIGINANGVVDAETRRRLGVRPDVLRQGGRN